jgi:hypothetical protein
MKFEMMSNRRIEKRKRNEEEKFKGKTRKGVYGIELVKQQERIHTYR